MPSKKPQPFIIALIGVVGAGKTHIARLLAHRLGAVRITTDDIRVQLRRHGKSLDSAPEITRERSDVLLRRGRSLILDFDAVNPLRRQELRRRARHFGARLYCIAVQAPQRLILARLRQKRYTPSDLFRDAAEATRAYFIRKKFRKKFRRFPPSFTIDNSQPLEPQINQVVREITGL